MPIAHLASCSLIGVESCGVRFARVREFACTTPRAPLRRLASFCQFCLKTLLLGCVPTRALPWLRPPRYCLLQRGHQPFSRGALGTFSAYVPQQFVSSTAPKRLRSFRATHTKSHNPNGACGSESADFPNLVHAISRALKSIGPYQNSRAECALFPRVPLM